MVIKNHENRVVSCPANHQNPEGSERCNTCGLPIIDYEKELDLLLKTLAEEDQHIRFAKEKIFLGIGDQGCRLVYDFYRSWGKSLLGSEFLMIESSGESKRFLNSSTEMPSKQQYTSPLLSLHLLPMAASKQVGYYGLGERLAANDPTLDDRLRRSGIKASTKKQSIFLLSALGGGTGSGASPFTLQRAKSINPHSRSMVIAVMPAAEEPDSSHFNAYCSLSRFINSSKGPLADMIILVDYDRLMKLRGVSSIGDEMTGESLLSYMIATLSSAIPDISSSQVDPSYLTKMSRSMGVHAFVPCMAVGRSMEIFGSIANILESAMSCPLAHIEKDSVMISYILIQVPERLASSLQEDKIKSALNKWNKNNFPRLKGSILQLSHSTNKADRIDLFLLLGGNGLATTARSAKEGFDRFKAVVDRKDWEQEFGVTSKIVPEVEKAINSYDSKLVDMAG